MNPFSAYKTLRERKKIVLLRPVEAQEKDLARIGLAMTMIWIYTISTVMFFLLAQASYPAEPGEVAGAAALATISLMLLLTAKYHPWYRRAIGIVDDDCD